MIDDLSAISGERAAYVPCDEVPFAVVGPATDANAIYGEDEGFVPIANAAAAEAADETDLQAVYGQSQGYVAGPCEECDDFEEFDGTEPSGWGSNNDDAWTMTGDGSSSVSGGYGHIDLTVPASVGPPPDTSKTVQFVTDPTTIRTKTSWTMRSKFAITASAIDGAESDSLIQYNVFTNTADQSAITFEWFSTGGAIAAIQVDENGSTVYSDSVGIAASPDGSDHELRWQFNVGGTQDIYLDGGIIFSAPAYNAAGLALSSTSLQMLGLLVKSGAFAGAATTNINFDYVRFCE